MKNNKTKTVIYGAGVGGEIVLEELGIENVLCFIDDNSELCSFNGLSVYTLESFFLSHFSSMDFNVLVAIPSLSNSVKYIDIFTIFQSKGIKVSCIVQNERLNALLPLTYQINDELLDELLGRKPNTILKPDDLDKLDNKIVMLIGAGGSIGRILSLVLCSAPIKKLICVDSSEENIYNLESKTSKYKPELVLGDIRDEFFMDYLFDSYQPEIIINAAAYKHVNLLEKREVSAFSNNIRSFVSLINKAKGVGAKKFIQISTDKAADPSTVMGKSKLFAEKYLGASTDENFSGKVVRFGNVLGSSGSVVPAFLDQLTRHNKVFVTDPDAERYFMLISEAVQLILRITNLKKDGIYILKMGEPRKIIDVAIKLIRYLGLENATIEFTGLKPGEKKSEQLFATDEKLTDIDKDFYFSDFNEEFNVENVVIDLRSVQPNAEEISRFILKYS